NQQDWTFTDQTATSGLDRPSISNGAAYADLDNDGDLDLVVNNINETAFVYENKSRQKASTNFLTIHLKGSELNPFGLGATVTIYHQNQQQKQVLYPVRGWQSSVDYRLHFGLGETTVIDSLRVIWPDGKTERRLNVEPNQIFQLDYKNATDSQMQEKEATKTVLFEADSERTIPFQHQENRFSDINRERLMPYLLSTQGPAVAVGDVNQDGLADVFIGGASQQAGQLFLQQPDGQFLKTINVSISADSSSEDIASAFFDADGDGDLDLYVGSGGNEFYRQNDLLRDRLYLNDGQGNFEKSEQSLPTFYNQASCVRPNDFDGDGDLDLFVGSRSIPVNYGMPPDSYLLENDGTGQFTDVTAQKAPQLKKVAMVTDALWSDYDQDGDADLLVVGEWLAIQVFENRNGQLERSEALFDEFSSRGWWQSIAAGDFDGDGDDDYIVGNWGTNTNLTASEEEPLNLYIKDFDKNLSKDAILTYYRQGKEYTFNGLDELASQMTAIKKRYRQYGAFADQGFREVFPTEQLRGAIRLQATTFSSVLLKNNGASPWEMESLPLPAQLSSIHAISVNDFDKDGHLDVLVGGNFHEVVPAIGRLDASYGTLLLGDGQGNLKASDNTDVGLYLRGAVRDMAIIDKAGKEILLVVRNSDFIQFFGIK
ncbi:MAG: FG-GAP-like repeat-containing protein, partial [Bacteroidota bacterium]